LKRTNFQQQLLDITNQRTFNALALELFQHQATNNSVYREYLKLLNIQPSSVQKVAEIPFLPIEIFKSHDVMNGSFEPEITFTSSGTTGKNTSRHFVRNPDFYRECFIRGFEHFYGNLKKYCILALLPSYLERKGSSLVHMAQGFMEESRHPENGFYLDELKSLSQVLQKLQNRQQPCLLLGVSYALLDLAARFPQPLSETIIMETGGMKGKRKEITREELHQTLGEAFGVNHIHSEYGMTELMSQAYASESGEFYCPPWMRVLIRERDDPMKFCVGRTGGINVIDLANIDSCAFIATSDLGRAYENGAFEVLGRFDASDVRGCNLMVG